MKLLSRLVLLCVCCCALVQAQAPVGTLEGQITDPAAALVSSAEVSVHNAQTGLTRTMLSSRQGAYHFSDLPIGTYLLGVKAQGFALYSVPSIRIDIGQVVSWPVQLRLASEHTEVSVSGQAVTVDTSQTLGNVAYRLGKKLEWDTIALKATNCPEATALIRRPYRKGWKLA